MNTVQEIAREMDSLPIKDQILIVVRVRNRTAILESLAYYIVSMNFELFERLFLLENDLYDELEFLDLHRAIEKVLVLSTHENTRFPLSHKVAALIRLYIPNIFVDFDASVAMDIAQAWNPMYANANETVLKEVLLYLEETNLLFYWAASLHTKENK